MEDFELDLTNLLSDDQIQALELENDKHDDDDNQHQQKEENKTVSTENLTIDDLFDSESVGNEVDDDIQGKTKETSTEGAEGSSPNLYSSIAKAFEVDGFFSNLEEEDIKGIKDADTFSEAVKKQIQLSLDEKQRRIDEALSDGVAPSEIKVYESNIDILDKLTAEDIEDESERGVDVRRTLIYNNYISKGFTPERAKTLTERSIESETDTDDAKEACDELKTFYKTKYKELRDAAHTKAEEEKRKVIKQAEDLKKNILEEKKAFGEINLDTTTRKKIYDAISNRKYKTDDGKMITEIEKFEKENPNEFIKNVAYAYVITEGFKNLNALTKAVENKAKKNGIKELESTLNSTLRSPDGSFKFVSGVSDKDSYSGWSLDL